MKYEIGQQVKFTEVRWDEIKLEAFLVYGRIISICEQQGIRLDIGYVFANDGHMEHVAHVGKLQVV